MASWVSILIQIVEVILQGLLKQKALKVSAEHDADIDKCERVLQILKS
jgi:hypothetical protein